MHTGPYVNTLLRHMDANVLSRLQLRRIDLPLRFELESPGASINNIFFVEKGIGSMTTSFKNGVQIETGMFGYESVVGASALMGVRHSLNRIFMKLPGYAYLSPVQAAHTEFQRNGIFQKLTLRYVQAQLTLSTQNAACNATHTYEQRLAQWLLICSDRAKQDNLEMAQEFVSEMLGSTRSTVSIAAAHLKAKGLIDYRRGNITLLDKTGLETESCECYRVVREHLESLVDFDTGFTV